tara:strand:- start:9843 stop:10433 length:591 start_codon:yes stop_codon:yes gene_type:complete
MKNNFAIRKRQVESILYLMITFLPLSSIANYFHNRIEFTYLYTISSIITLYIFYKYKKKKQISKIAKQILILLYIIFFSFLILGDQRSFDIFWVLTLPLIVVTIENYKNLKKWLYLFLFLLILSLVLSYLDLEIISYDSFALWSLLWAGLDEHTAEQLNLTAPLHDIGKVGIEDSILNKPGKLTNQEFTIMKAHSK